MGFISFNFFSTVENIATITLLLSIFKYRVLDYIPQMLLASLVMSLISHTMRFEFANSSFVPVIMIFTLFLFIWISFKVAPLYALIITIVGYVVYGLLQTMIFFGLQSLGLLTQEMVEKEYSYEGYLLQFITFIAAYIISNLLRKNNYGFNWVPYNKSAKFKLIGDNLLFFVTVVISVFIIGLVFYLFLSGYLHLLANFVLIFFVLALLFYLSRKQEIKYYD
jgi:hypothetical protein